ncbi:hypothetical protein BJ684DRAFT_16763 [Piptocephalis cylindrospora]|uniref:Coiled-coil domain-containing protein 6 n=1 Tax=Piptocephalis cylindrospora TaxID=1907219 RepID=A0A4P9Y1W8_9FUNG|nr:hypothetical protein BJ684DRAFT_16763 [Piptocephalis cylindrospora]|eukprot:RKP12785.1 hypothetical protein BJ684DRAFT_16763 [Piptocephalis cylindrospora]
MEKEEEGEEEREGPIGEADPSTPSDPSLSSKKQEGTGKILSIPKIASPPSSRSKGGSHSLEAEIKRIKLDLEMERGQVNILRHENQLLRQQTVDMQLSAEQEEEAISNRLLRHIAELKREKNDLLTQVEQEEEYMTNTLQRKLSKLQQEKVDIENALEQEQEAIVNRLQKQLDALRCQQSQAPSPSLSVRSGSFVQDSGPLSGQPTSPGLPSPIVGSPSMKWRAGHSASGSDHASTQMVSEVLKAEINAGRIRQSDLEKEVIAQHNQLSSYRKELIDLRKRLSIPVDDLVDEDVPVTIRALVSPRSRTNSNSNIRPVDIPRNHRGRSSSSHRSVGAQAPESIVSGSSTGNGNGTFVDGHHTPYSSSPGSVKSFGREHGYFALGVNQPDPLRTTCTTDFSSSPHPLVLNRFPQGNGH